MKWIPFLTKLSTAASSINPFVGPATKLSTRLWSFIKKKIWRKKKVTEVEEITPACKLPQLNAVDTGVIRQFETGATRDTTEGKLDYEGFLSPLVLECFADYMNDHREQSDGSLRDSDNWQKGIPLDVYMKSGWRHFFDWWKQHRKLRTKATTEVVLCALLFNVMGYLHEYLKAKQDWLDSEEAERRGGL